MAGWVWDGSGWRSIQGLGTNETPPAVTGYTEEIDEVAERMRITGVAVNGATQSVLIRYRVNGGAMQSVQQVMDVSPGGGGYATPWIAVVGGQRLEMFLRPYGAEEAQGTAGTEIQVGDHTFAIEPKPAMESWSATGDQVGNWARGHFRVKHDTGSVRVHRRFNGPDNQWVELDGSPMEAVEDTGYDTELVFGQDGDLIEFQFTPYSGFAGDGVAGEPRYDSYPLAVLSYDPAVTKHVIGQAFGSAQSTFTVSSDTTLTEVNFRIGTGNYQHLQDIVHTNLESRTDVVTDPVFAAPGQTVTIKLTPRGPSGSVGEDSTESIEIGGSGGV